VTPGSLHIEILDGSTEIAMVGGGAWALPVGPETLVARELERADRPAPEQLTNALGIVTDYLDDVVRESPIILDAPAVGFSGRHAVGLGRVEIGLDELPAGYTLARVDADEVFRTIVAEPIAQRLHNPGLEPADVETVIGTCCIVLAVMRRLELAEVSITSEARAS
jgi:exopolyphosphatase/pppGpp-phosphohydrolase